MRVAKIVKPMEAESTVGLSGAEEGVWGDVRICSSKDIKFQLCKTNKFYRLAEHHCAYSYQYFIIHLKMCSEGRSPVVFLPQ